MTSFPLGLLYPTYAFLDPAGPKKRSEGIKHVASRSAIIVCGQDELSRVYVLHAWAARCPTDTLIETIITINERWRPKVFGCEENNLASLFADCMRLNARWANMKLPLVGVPQPSTIEKDARIRQVLQPLVANGRVLLRAGDPGMAELRTEITSFPMNFRKDLIDALASCCRMMPLRAKRAGVDSEREAYLRYLRESGAKPVDIERAAASWASKGNPLATGGRPGV
jgi:hypothetical protein